MRYTEDQVLVAVMIERARQRQCLEEGRFSVDCSDPAIPDSAKLPVLGEEFGEVCEVLAMLGDPVSNRKGKTSRSLRSELIQVAAVAVAWAWAIDVEDVLDRPPEKTC